MKRLLAIGWQLALAAAVLGFVAYRLRFAPIPVAGDVATITVLWMYSIERSKWRMAAFARRPANRRKRALDVLFRA